MQGTLLQTEAIPLLRVKSLISWPVLCFLMFNMKVDLYYRQDCPYSTRVRNFIAAHQLKKNIQFHDVDRDEESLDELEDLTGNDQVPCLVVDEEPFLEST